MTTLATAGKRSAWATLDEGVTLRRGARTPRALEILTPEALRLIARMHRSFDAGRRELLEARARRQALYDAGALPDYLDRNRLAQEEILFRVRRLEIARRDERHGRQDES